MAFPQVQNPPVPGLVPQVRARLLGANLGTILKREQGSEYPEKLRGSGDPQPGTLRDGRREVFRVVG